MHISHPHPSLSRERVLGRFLAIHACTFWLCARCAKGARGKPEKDDWSTRVAVREPPEAPRLLFSSQGSHKNLKFPAWKFTMEGPHWALSAKKCRLWMGVGLLWVVHKYLGGLWPSFITI